MKPIIKTILLFAVAVSLIACNRVSPDRIVAQTWLNTNNITSHYSPKFFRLLLEMKSKGNIPVVNDNSEVQGTAVEYVKQYLIAPVDEAMEKVEKLPVDEDTEGIINASLEVFTYGKEIFEQEYLAIAEMIDEGKPEEEIRIAVDKLFATHDADMQAKLSRLDELVFPYAEKHNVPIRTQR